MELSHSLPALFALLTTALVVFVVSKNTQHLGWLMDVPDGRKQHEAPTPSIGGLCFSLVFMATMGLYAPKVLGQQYIYMGSAVLLTLMGALDDALDIKPLTKLLTQLACIGVSMWTMATSYFTLGVDISGWGSLGPIVSFVGTLLLLGYYTNAFNMTDGVDGQAGSVGTVTLLFAAAIAQLMGDHGLFKLMAWLAASVMGFLVWNLRSPWLPKARVFMGDAGSLMLGFSIAWLTFYLSRKGLPETTVLWLLAFPLFDATTVIVRRLQKGKNPMRADRSHLHHLLQGLGMKVPCCVAIATSLTIVFCTIGLVFWMAKLGFFTQLVLWLLAGFGYFLTVSRFWKKVGNADANSI